MVEEDRARSEWLMYRIKTLTGHRRTKCREFARFLHNLTGGIIAFVIPWTVLYLEIFLCVICTTQVDLCFKKYKPIECHGQVQLDK